jgi:hypothetical protein
VGDIVVLREDGLGHCDGDAVVEGMRMAKVGRSWKQDTRKREKVLKVIGEMGSHMRELGSEA